MEAQDDFVGFAKDDDSLPVAKTPKPTSQAVTKKPPKEDAATKEARALKKRSQDANKKYGRGNEIALNRVMDKKNRASFKNLENRYKETQLQALDAEILHENESGFLEAENELEKTYRVRQDDILKDADVTTASKGSFNLSLDFGPYTCKYTRNGKGLALAGRQGHVATMTDWRSGKLGFELNLGETVRDVQWIANQNLAVAQKKLVYIYDHSGVEIHKMSKHIEVAYMDYLHYHSLLVTLGNSGYLKYHDVGTGQMIAELPTKMGTPTAMRQNPWNAIVNVGHQNGTISLWTPNLTEPVVKLQAHRGPVRSMSVDREGRYMVSVGQDQKMSVWDIRMFKPVHEYYLPRPGASIAVSDRGLTAVGWGTQVSVWKGLFDKNFEDQQKISRPYMAWGGEGQRIEKVTWCPLEDLLGVSHNKGMSTVVVPGAGEANFDALEINPYQTTKQRNESEVRGQLEKLQPETISLDPNFIGNLDLASADTRRKEAQEARPLEEEVLRLKNRGRGRNSALRRVLRKKGAKNIIDEKRLMLEAKYKEQTNRDKAQLAQQRERFGPALSRFARSGG